MSCSYDSLNVRFGMTVSMFRKYVIDMTPIIMFLCFRKSHMANMQRHMKETNAMNMAEKSCIVY